MTMAEVLEEEERVRAGPDQVVDSSKSPPENWDDWEQPERRSSADIPTLHLDGFDGPMDLLLDLAERQRVDLGQMSILALADQFAAALEALGDRVPIERRADWVVLATRLVLLRTRLLFPASPEAAADAEREAQAEIQRIEEMQVMRAAVAWLQAQPQLGQDVFTRPPPEETREVGYVALMEACLVLLRGKPATEAFAPAPVYRQVVPDLWRISDAMERIQKMLPDFPDGAPMVAFLPEIGPEDSNNRLKVRAAVASTFVAGLELAKQDALQLQQAGFWETISFTSSRSQADSKCVESFSD
jgi:segregation and condensation protein A